MLEVVRAPDVYTGKFYDHATIFLAGSIEMGIAEDWQRRVLDELKDEPAIVFNPRRLMWDSSWEQSEDNPQFKEQVMWELTYLNRADIRFFYFDPNTKSPISLLELGLALASPDDAPIIVCPEGFYRKGNVDCTARFYDEVPVHKTLDIGIEILKNRIREYNDIIAHENYFREAYGFN